MAAPPRELSHRDRVRRSDTRWLLAWLGVFAAAMLTVLVAHQLYRFTGPHPAVTSFLRSLKHYARWLVPGQKERRHPLPLAVLLPGLQPHYATSSDASGHDAHRANT